MGSLEFISNERKIDHTLPNDTETMQSNCLNKNADLDAAGSISYNGVSCSDSHAKVQNQMSPEMENDSDDIQSFFYKKFTKK